jgi:hypothetical protein
MTTQKHVVIIDTNSLNCDLDFRIDYEKLKPILSKITKTKIEELEFILFDNQDSAKHTFHFSIETKGYKLILKEEDFYFSEPKYIHCHCCESLVLDPATNKNTYNRDLGASITNYVYSNLGSFSKFSLLSSDNNLGPLIESLDSKGLLSIVIVPNINKKGLKTNSKLKHIFVGLNEYYNELGGQVSSSVSPSSKIQTNSDEQKAANKNALSKFGKNKR